MEEFWGKLTNLSYDLFGVFIPGAFLLLFLLLWWFALGSVPGQIGIPDARNEFIQSVPDSFLLIAATMALIYFFGNLLVWISRKHGSYERTIIWRVIRSIHFRIPFSSDNYDGHLKHMMEASALRLGLPIDEFTWRRFYPLAKILLAERLKKSLVSIYQNKYTLHRSITASAVVLFWLAALSVVIGAIFRYPPSVHWGGMVALLVGSLIVIWGFSASANYYWKMWGNVIVTETYAVLSGATN